MAVIAAAARRVMTARGVRLTQVADVARDAKVAAGTIYLYVREKDALVELALRDAGDLPLDQAELPLEADPSRLEGVVLQIVRTRFAFPALEAARKTRSSAGLEAVFAEVYDVVYRWRHLVALLDSCSADVPLLARVWDEEVRRPYFTALASCLQNHADGGIIRADLDCAAAARALVEMIVYMAHRRRRDRVPPSSDEDSVRTTTLALAMAALERQSSAPCA